MTTAAPRPNLSSAQRAAVEAPAGVFVDAGAGSGKTTVLVERYVRAVTEHNHLPSQVLAVTFTTRAAGEMRSRIRARLRGEQRNDLIPQVESGWIGTIHATCRRILGEFPSEAGLPRGLRVADRIETILLRDAAFERAVVTTIAELGEQGMWLVAAYGRESLREIASGLLIGARIRGVRPLAPQGTATRADVTALSIEMTEAARVMSQAGTDSATAVLCRQIALDLLGLLARNPDEIELTDLSDYARGDRVYKELIAELERVARDALAAQLHDPLQLLLDRYAAAYEQGKADVGAVDNDDLQLRTLCLLQEHAAVRVSLQERFREIMIDEFQDTDSLQTAIIELLKGAETSLLAVGDEQQAIYGFRGAEVGVFRATRDQAHADEATVVVSLQENRRSSPPVLAAINAIFSRESRLGHRPLTSVRIAEGDPAGPVVEFLIGSGKNADHGREIEATLVARRLRQLIDAGSCRPGEIALVFRAGTKASIFERALRAEGLPTVSSTGRNFLKRQPVGDIIAMLRVLWNRYDDLALLGCLASPMAGVSNDGLALMRAAVEWEFSDAMESLESIGLKDDDLRRAVTLRDAIARLRLQAGRLSLGDLVSAVVAETRYDLALLTRSDGPERLANVDKLQRVARMYDDVRGTDLPGFVRAIESGRLDAQLQTEGVISSEHDDAIRLMTVHAAKGLEFRVVVFADTGTKPPKNGASALVAASGMVAAVVPSVTNKLCRTRELELLIEDRREAGKHEGQRVAYVACTRAEDRLIISGARSGTGSGDSTLGWLLELLDEDADVGERVLNVDDAMIGMCVADAPVGPALRPVLPADTAEFIIDDRGPQLSFDVEAASAVVTPAAAGLPPLAPLPVPAGLEPPILSYSALDQFEHCAYRFQIERMLGVPSVSSGAGAAIGKAVHRALELGGDADAGRLLLDQDSAAPPVDQLAAGEALARWQRSPLCRRFASLAPLQHEQPFLLRIGEATVVGRFDLSAVEGDRLVIGDLKVASLNGLSPDQRRDAGYTVQEEVYALAALEAGYAAVEIAFQWIGDDDSALVMATRVFEAADRVGLRERLEQRVRRALEGPWAATPSRLICEGCPALGLICAGPALSGSSA